MPEIASAHPVLPESLRIVQTIHRALLSDERHRACESGSDIACVAQSLRDCDSPFPTQLWYSGRIMVTTLRFCFRTDDMLDSQ